MESDISKAIIDSKVGEITVSVLSFILKKKIERYTKDNELDFFKEMFNTNKKDFKKFTYEFYNDLKVLNVNILFKEGIFLHQEAVLKQQRKEAEQMAIKHKEIAAINNQADATREAANINAQAILQSGEIIAKSNDGIAQATSESGKTIAKSNDRIAQATIDSGKTIAQSNEKIAQANLEAAKTIATANDNNPKPKFKGDTSQIKIFNDTKTDDYIVEFDYLPFDYTYQGKKYTGLKINQVYLHIYSCSIGSNKKVKCEIIKNSRDAKSITDGDLGYHCYQHYEDIEILISAEVSNSNSKSITDPTDELSIGGRLMFSRGIQATVEIITAQAGLELEGNVNYTMKDKVINNTNQMTYDSNKFLRITLSTETRSNSKDNILKLEKVYIYKVGGLVTPDNISIPLKTQHL